MNKFLIITSTIFSLLILATPIYSQASTASDSADVEDIIKENVKKRIREVVKGDTDLKLTSIAYTGSLTSIANETLTINTLSGIKLASTSANTAYENKDGTEASIDDLAIDNYIVALGFINGSQVLDVRKIITHSEPPVSATNQSEYGLISSHNLEDDTITITNPFTNQPITALLGKKTDFLEVNPDNKPIPTDSDAIIVNQSYALIIYSPAEENLIESILIKNIPGSKQNNIATPSGEEQLPPELQR